MADKSLPRSLPANWSLAVHNDIVSIFQNHLDLPEAISVDTRLEELGVTSFGFIELVLKIENQIGLEFEDRYLNYLEFQTVENVISYCQRLASADRGGPTNPNC
ncbi:acyl carrier protein [Phaeobacter sp. B1627]|uniref:acyl carrier protein n=1 Tax=Phaeobacter sp. B1627 TaxID=2583809 RepID=UPI0011189894|nr:phosphopantetheine-binding protein [Phaeobacter sp. B1627]TNJ42301.1 hypothetical protein FGE21_11505 [Phaeobacter sp. B1627]